MLIDSFAPDPDAVETHSIAINASPETVYQALWTADLGGSLIIKLLLGMRSLPEFILRGGHLRRERKLTLQTIIDSGFGILVNEPEEVVLGVIGKFWRPAGNLLPFDRESFAGAPPSGVAQAVWNFTIKEDNSGGTILSTETRVTCGDSSSRRKFRMYWVLVRPFSGLIRLLMLRAVKREVGVGSTSK